MLAQVMKFINRNKNHILIMCSFFIFLSFFEKNNESYSHESHALDMALHQDSNLLSHEALNQNKNKVSSDLLAVILLDSHTVQQKYFFVSLLLMTISLAFVLKSQNSRYISNLPPPAFA